MEERSKILIVDDERLNINLLVDLLKPKYQIMAAINGAQALKAARSVPPPDLILLDVMMPEMDGHEVCRQLKSDTSTRDIPVIFVTAMGQVSDETHGFELGAVDYITKPISPAVVEARVKTHLALKRSLKELQSAYQIIESQKDRMQKELDIGKSIQLSMLPNTFPAFPEHQEFEIYATMQAAREVGGDFYDFFLIDEDHLCVCIGDVSGKGVPAALFMSIAKVLIKSRAADDLSPASILTHVNDEICANNEACMFVTIFLGIIDIRNGILVYTNAGHNPTYIKRANAPQERLEELHGPVVGAMDGLAYRESTENLSQNDLLVLYTDGVTEAMDKDDLLFSDDRLANFLQSTPTTDPHVLTDSIVSEVSKFAAGVEQFDDITILVLKFQSQPILDSAKVFSLTIPNELDQIDLVNDQFGDFCENNGVEMGGVMKLNMVFDELINNIISYGFKDEGPHEIDITAELLGQRLTITISDGGIPFNPFFRIDPDTKSSLEEREIGGLGIHLVKKVMDDVSYKRRVDKNVVTLIKHLKD
ncbi:SpoIIE family protein phosphatase [bacterium]|nr:SpoIIE family protein phosphatase [bacterium]